MLHLISKKLPAIILILLLTSVIITRRHIFFFLPTLGYFNDWTVVELSLFDLVLILSAAVVFGIKQYQTRQGRYNRDAWPSLFEKTNFGPTKKSPTIICRLILLMLAVWILTDGILISHYNSFEAKILSLFSAWQILKIYLALWVFENLKTYQSNSNRGSTKQVLANSSYDNITQLPLANHQFSKIIVRSLMFLSIFESVVVLGQFFYQSNLRLSFLGEEFFDSNTANVAKIKTAAGLKFIRAYGTFSHPNILAFFLLLALVAWLISWSRRHHNRSLPAAMTGLPEAAERKNFYDWLKLFWTIGFSLNLIALILTFSRSAWLTALAGIILYFIFNFWLKIKNRNPGICLRNFIGIGRKNNPKEKTGESKKTGRLPMALLKSWQLLAATFYGRGPARLLTRQTNRQNQLGRGGWLTFKRLWLYLKITLPSLWPLLSGLLLTAITIFLVFDLAAARIPITNIKETLNIDYRLFTLTSLAPTNYQTFLIGQSEHKAVLEYGKSLISKTKNKSLEDWQIQPPANLYWLILTQWGIIGLILFSLFVWSLGYSLLINNTINKRKFYLLLSFILSIFFIVANLDHFLLSLPEGFNLFIIFLLLTYY